LFYKSNGLGATTFEKTRIGANGTYNSQLLKVDFDKDGDMDILLNRDGSIGYFSNNCTKEIIDFSFVNLDLYTQKNKQSAASIDYNDYDGDGDMDIIAGIDAGGFGDPKVFLFINSGNGTYQKNAVFDKSLSTNIVKFADLDGKLPLEIVAGSYGPIDISLQYFYKDGSSWKGVVIDPVVRGCNATKVFDFNNDGKVDLLNADNYGLISIFMNKSTAQGISFDKIKIYESISTPGTLTLLDFNKDGIMDFLATFQENSAEYGSALFLNTGSKTDPKFTAQKISDVRPCFSMEAGDFDKDGDYDFSYPVANNAVHWIKNENMSSSTSYLLSEKMISCFPNPSFGNFTITSESMIQNIVVTNIVGSIIQSIEDINTKFHILEIKEKGIYNVTIVGDNFTETLKVVRN
jgi:hypothetical protein